MKTVYVFTMVLLACATLMFGIASLVFGGEAFWLVQATFNCMIAAGALLSYRES